MALSKSCRGLESWSFGRMQMDILGNNPLSGALPQTRIEVKGQLPDPGFKQQASSDTLKLPDVQSMLY